MVCIKAFIILDLYCFSSHIKMLRRKKKIAICAMNTISQDNPLRVQLIKHWLRLVRVPKEDFLFRYPRGLHQVHTPFYERREITRTTTALRRGTRTIISVRHRNRNDDIIKRPLFAMPTSQVVDSRDARRLELYGPEPGDVVTCFRAALAGPNEYTTHLPSYHRRRRREIPECQVRQVNIRHRIRSVNWMYK